MKDDITWLKEHGTIRAMERNIHTFEMLWLPKNSILIGGSLLTIGTDEADAARKMVNLVKTDLFKHVNKSC